MKAKVRQEVQETAAKEPSVKEPPAKEPASKEKAAKAQKGKDRGERRKENAIVRYFRQTAAELRKTTWPTRNEAVRLTAIVLAVTVAMSAMLGVVDWLFSLLFSFLIKASTG